MCSELALLREFTSYRQTAGAPHEAAIFHKSDRSGDTLHFNPAAAAVAQHMLTDQGPNALHAHPISPACAAHPGRSSISIWQMISGTELKRLALPRRGIIRAWALALALTLIPVLLGACGDRAPKFRGSDITGLQIGGELAMSDHNGKARRLSDFNGKVVVVFFGYTQCPDVCPTTMSELSETMKELGSKSNEIQVLFVTVDPERDTQELLAQYVPAFNPSFLGLRGTPEELETTTKAFKVFYQKSPSPGGGYTVDHTAGSFVFDKRGRVRLLVPYGAGPKTFVHDLSELLRSS